MAGKLRKELNPTTNRAIEKRIWWISIILILWAVVQFLVGSNFLGLIIVLYCLILIFTSHRSLIVVMVSSILGILLLFSPVLVAVTDIRSSALAIIEFPRQSIKDFNSPNSGQDVLPPVVQQMLSLIHNHSIQNYRLSDQLQDPLTIQRIIETAWPIKMDDKSSFLLISNDEISQYSPCVLIEQREDVALVHCP